MQAQGLDACWRAVNYLSVGQIYLLDNRCSVSPPGPLSSAPVSVRTPRARREVCARLGFLGLALDNVLNDAAAADADVSRAGAAVRIAVIRAREELIAARAARKLLA